MRLSSKQAVLVLVGNREQVKAPCVDAGVDAEFRFDESGRLAGDAGHEEEVEAALEHNRARYYDPGVGRWMSRDPLGFDACDADANLYRYVTDR